MDTLLGKNIEELTEIAIVAGLPRFTGKQLADWIYRKRVSSIDEMTNISVKGREALKSSYSVGRHSPVAQAESADGTRKFLFRVTSNDEGRKAEGECRVQSAKCKMKGGEAEYIETVYIPDEDRATLCVSTQAGCKMGCRFCMTGTLGFHSHLDAGEILNQIFEIDKITASQPSEAFHLTNIVYMGEGEPMDNINHVMRSLEIMTAPYACGWSPHRITVSSVGYTPGLKRFLEESECHLAISLHNPFSIERQQIMPIEKAYTLRDVLDLIKQYDWQHQRRISFEYICWAGQNDTPKHAKELVHLLHGLNCRVNLIRFHAGVDCDFPASNEKSMLWLQQYLNDNGITTTIRRSRGEDILAACGMLVNSLTKQQSEKHIK